jgi:hypothetical protein
MMKYDMRYDIKPSQTTVHHWVVIDTRNNNMPVSEHPSHSLALRAAKAKDRG